MPTKDVNRIRINGGGNFFFKLPAGSWVDFGKIAAGYIFEDSDENIEIPLAGGETTEQTGKKKVKLTLDMAQTDKEAMDYKYTIQNKTGEVYFYDGIVNNKHSEYYATLGKCNVIINKVDGATPQVIRVEITLYKQTANVSVADTGLPTGKYAAAGTVTGVNPYYVVIDTAVA